MSKFVDNSVEGFLIIMRSIYSLILVGGALFVLGMAPIDYSFTFSDYCKIAFLIIHLGLIFISLIPWHFQKSILIVNIFFYLGAVISLLWMLTENDINFFIVVVLVVWLILFVDCISQILKLQNSKKDSLSS